VALGADLDHRGRPAAQSIAEASSAVPKNWERKNPSKKEGRDPRGFAELRGAERATYTSSRS